MWDEIYTSSHMTATEWGHHPADEADVARERIIDAAETAVRRWGPSRARIDDIATEARCGRTTIYRYFGNRDNVIVEVVLRQGRRHLETLVEHLSSLPDNPEKIVEAVVFAVDLVRKDDHLRWAFSPGESPAQIEGLSEALYDLATSTWLEFLRTDPTLKGALRPGVDPALAAEWVLRAMLSYLTFPGRTGQDRRAMRRQLRQLLVPALFREA
jgi:AcrR family transcriptional regulator